LNRNRKSRRSSVCAGHFPLPFQGIKSPSFRALSESSSNTINDDNKERNINSPTKFSNLLDLNREIQELKKWKTYNTQGMKEVGAYNSKPKKI
jgi:hypothetical protein